MRSTISFKNLFLMFIIALFFAVGMVFLLNFALAGPKLGMHYDLLQEYKEDAVSREILIINTDDYIEGADIFSVLITLTEMKASSLILAGNVSSSSSPIIIDETEIRRRFIDEYDLLGHNIRGLFEGIRMGSVTPSQAPLFVDQVIEISVKGRDRLISALIDRDEEILRAVSVFGNFLLADVKIRADKDGKIRRINPMEGDAEHPVFNLLKNRYAVSQFESSGKTMILWLRGHDSSDIDIILDNNGNIITSGVSKFRSVDIDIFRRYDEALNVMRNLLEQANELRVFSQTPPDRIPLFLYENSRLLFDEMLGGSNSEKTNLWIDARLNYFSALDEYFAANNELFLVEQLEEKIADTDPSNESELSILIESKNAFVKLFSQMRTAFNELSSLRKILSEELEMSMCIMGSPDSARYSALLSDAIITGKHIKPAEDKWVYICSITLVFIVLLITFMMRPAVQLPLGCVLSAAAASVFCGIFIFYSYWIDPLIVLGSSLTGTIIIFICKCVYLNYRASSFRVAYRAAVPKNVLNNLIKAGKPRLNEVKVCYAAVIAIKDANLLNKENKDKPQESVKFKRNFYNLAKKVIFSADAVVAGFEGDTIYACFGSSLELKPVLSVYKWGDDGLPLAKTYHPVEKAYGFINELLKNEKITWRFGIDAGNCVFSWSPETGYIASGPSVIRAKMLVTKAAKIKERALVTDSILEKINIKIEKAGFLSENQPYYIFPN